MTTPGPRGEGNERKGNLCSVLYGARDEIDNGGEWIGYIDL